MRMEDGELIDAPQDPVNFETLPKLHACAKANATIERPILITGSASMEDSAM